MMNSKSFLFILTILFAFTLVANFNDAHAQPLENVTADIVKYDGENASVKLTWHHDDTVFRYEAGVF